MKPFLRKAGRFLGSKETCGRAIRTPCFGVLLFPPWAGRRLLTRPTPSPRRTHVNRPQLLASRGMDHHLQDDTPILHMTFSGTHTLHQVATALFKHHLESEIGEPLGAHMWRFSPVDDDDLGTHSSFASFVFDLRPYSTAPCCVSNCTRPQVLRRPNPCCAPFRHSTLLTWALHSPNHMPWRRGTPYCFATTKDAPPSVS